MRHFVAYHNTERMGQPLSAGNPLGLVTNKAVRHLLQNTVWFIQGDGTSPKQYSLGSVFMVSEVGDVKDAEFSRFAEGQGHVFQPPVPLNDRSWFKGFFKAMAHFSLGVHEITDPQCVEELIQLAAQAGYQLPAAKDPST